MMKLRLIFLIYCGWSHWTLAVEPIGESPFIYSHEARTLALSALSASVAPFTYQSLVTTEQIAHVQLKANTTGIALGLPNRHPEYVNANPYGITGRQRIAEEIGEMGAHTFAQKTNYVPIYLGTPGKGR
jgi:hypothetical protein